MFAMKRANVTLSAVSTHLVLKRNCQKTFCKSTPHPADETSDFPSNKAQATGKRFWKIVEIMDHEESLVVTLDKRPLKTPAGEKLAIPKRKLLLASLISHEWDTQETVVKAHALPMTSLAARAIDCLRNDPDRGRVRDDLLKYLDTDTIRFYEDHPPGLVDLQERHWTPLLSWTREEFGVDIEKSASLFSHPPKPETREAFVRVLNELDEWQLASVERATHTSKSFIIALALLRGRISAEDAALASEVEVNSQIQKWGEVEDTHDVAFHDTRRQLASAACVLVNS